MNYSSIGKVMNNNDLRRFIFTFFRKKAKLYCGNCNRVLIWDQKPVCAYYTSNNTNHAKCSNCWKRDMFFLTWSGT
jgi:hypothetical protein